MRALRFVVKTTDGLFVHLLLGATVAEEPRLLYHEGEPEEEQVTIPP
jgi:hypothetical protein